MRNKPGRRMVFHCHYCNKESSNSFSHFIKKKRHFCSTKCYSDYRREIMTREEHNRYGTGLPEYEQRLRRWCRSTTNHAIRDGVLERGYCEICARFAEAHHDNYQEPLLVRWLCFRHHRAYHKQIYENPELLEKKLYAHN